MNKQAFIRLAWLFLYVPAAIAATILVADAAYDIALALILAHTGYPLWLASITAVVAVVAPAHLASKLWRLK